jgi:hypothetical protein
LGRGPVPWVHTHETLAHHVHSDDALAWHVQHFHSPGDESEHGWHIHWTLPWDIVNCPCQHDTTSAEESASALEMPVDVAQSDSVSQADAKIHAGTPPMLWTDGRANRPPWDPLGGSGLHFRESYSSRVTLRALYCVLQC